MANKDHQPVRGLRWWWSKWWVRLPIAIVGVISWLQTFAWMVKWIRTHHGELLIFGPSAAVAFVLAVFGFIALVIALGPERVTAWVDHFRGHAPALQETSTTREASEPEEAPESDERTFIDVTPAYLVGLFEGHTDLHTLKLTEPFVGKWMKVSGPLGNVLSNRETILQVTFQSGSIFDPDHEFFTVYMYFDRKHWDDRLAVIPPGSNITVVGRLQKFDRVDVHLENCELED